MSHEKLAQESRKRVLDLVYNAQTSHIGSLFSAADIFAVLFSKIDLNKDIFVLSAGWKAALLYFHLWKLGRITEEELDSYCQKIKCEDCDGTGIDNSMGSG
jgi:transketolase